MEARELAIEFMSQDYEKKMPHQGSTRNNPGVSQKRSLVGKGGYNVA